MHDLDQTIKNHRHRDLPRKWNRNDAVAAEEGRNLLWTGVLNPEALLPVVTRVAGRVGLRDAVLEQCAEAIPEITIARVDATLNEGDLSGVAFSEYEKPPRSLPGEDGLKLRITKGSVEGRVIKRRYRWPKDGSLDLQRWSDVERLAWIYQYSRIRHLVGDVARMPEQNQEMDMEDLIDHAVAPVPMNADSGTGAGEDDESQAEESPALALPPGIQTALLEWTHGAAATLAGRLNGAQAGGTPWRMYVITLLFLEWFIESCRPGWDEALSFSSHVSTRADLPALPGESIDALDGRIDPTGWAALAAAASRAGDSLAHASPDPGAWWVRHEKASPSLYEQWRDATTSLRGPAQRNTVEQARHRAHKAHAFDDLHRLIGSNDSGYGRGGGLRELFSPFLEGDIDPEPAAALRRAFREDPELLRAFYEYVGDRIAWGYVPRPAVAMLREAIRAGKGWLGFKLGTLPATMDVLAADVRRAQEALARQSRLVPVSLPTAAAPFTGFGLTCGAGVEATLLDPAGRQIGNSDGRVVDAGCDPDTRSAWITVQMTPAPEGPAVLAARFEASACWFSFAGEIRDGRAEIRVEELPREIDSLAVDGWFVLPAEDVQPL